MKFLLCLGLSCILAVSQAAGSQSLASAIAHRIKNGQIVVDTIANNAQALKNYIGQPKLDAYLKTEQDIRNFLSVISKIQLSDSDLATLIPLVQKNASDAWQLYGMFKGTFLKKCYVPAFSGIRSFFWRVQYFANGVAKIVDKANSAELTAAYKAILDDVQTFKKL
ncbi:uncharacterized protein LOC129743199 [Uranotaenia lowii]|uniref:uncharacterized protein LOC129743199 n=1 Tax=Uranotaenia lowii TaxID=190385 RepID=UPI00247ABABE|nr:uncharacterized protein LOC129743199 [Uranotaenia lowii]